MTAAPPQPAHAKLSPSSASGWMTCPDYPNANEGLPDDGSEAAAEGTAAHAISDDCLLFGFDAYDFIGHTTRIKDWAFVWDDDDADLLQPGLDLMRAYQGDFFGEHRVDLSQWLGENQFGTLDRGIVTKDLIRISDLKWGRGVPVSPVQNKQLMLYALGFYWNVARHLTKATEFSIEIDQPRCSGGGGFWRVSLDELLEFGEEAKRAAEATRAPNPPRVASGPGCMWCKRKNAPATATAPGGCDTYDMFAWSLASQNFDETDDDMEIGLPPSLPRLLTPERRAFVLEHRSLLERWLEQMADAELADALAGRPTPARKAVEGRKGRDVFFDGAAAQPVVVSILGEDSFTKKLKTPTQLLKEIRDEDDRKLLDPLIKRGVKKPVMVPEADARPAIANAQSKLDEEDE